MSLPIREPSSHNKCFSVGALVVNLAGSSEEDVSLSPSLVPFGITFTTPDINIAVESVASLRTASRPRIFESGATWRLHEHEAGFQFDVSAPMFGEKPYKTLLIDSGFRRAKLQISQEAMAMSPRATQSLDYPLDELLIMHRLTQEKAIELHGTGIVRADGDSNLFVGHSGAGKSTTTRLWTDVEDVEVLSDDRIIVRRDEGAAARPRTDDSEERVGILRLRDRSASPNGHSAQDDKSKYKMRMYGTPWHGEAMFASPNSAPLSRIFVLEHGHGNVITPLTPSQAVAELFARSFVPFHRHEYVDSALAFLEELSNSVPVYRYSFEPDQRAVEKIRQFRD